MFSGLRLMQSTLPCFPLVPRKRFVLNGVGATHIAGLVIYTENIYVYHVANWYAIAKQKQEDTELFWTCLLKIKGFLRTEKTFLT